VNPGVGLGKPYTLELIRKGYCCSPPDRFTQLREELQKETRPIKHNNL
jgi:hypothetical protein